MRLKSRSARLARGRAPSFPPFGWVAAAVCMAPQRFFAGGGVRAPGVADGALSAAPGVALEDEVLGLHRVAKLSVRWRSRQARASSPAIRVSLPTLNTRSRPASISL